MHMGTEIIKMDTLYKSVEGKKLLVEIGTPVSLSRYTFPGKRGIIFTVKWKGSKGRVWSRNG